MTPEKKNQALQHNTETRELFLDPSTGESLEEKMMDIEESTEGEDSEEPYSNEQD